MCLVFFQAEDGKRGAHYWLEFRRVLFRSTSAPAFPADPRHMILLVLESVRGEVVGKRIDGRLVAPNITALAASGTWVKEAYSHVDFTSFSLKRSDERRVGKECVGTCRFRWSPLQ